MNCKQVRRRCWVMLYSAILGLGLTTIRATADEWDKKTVVTFNMPVEVPGKVLQPGTYVFKLLDSPSDRHVVQIYGADQKKLYATILAVPNYRLKPSDKPVISFEERPSGQPEALRAFFYPGDNFGQEFVYPHKRATELAKRTNQDVLSMSDNMSKNMAAGAKSSGDARVKEMEKTEVSGVSPSGDPVELTIVVLEKPEN